MESSTTGAGQAKKEAEAKAKRKEEKKKEDNALFVEQDDEVDEEEDNESPVKEEPTDDDDRVMTDVPRVDEAATMVDDNLLPVQKVKVRRKLSPSKSVSETSSAVPSPEPEVVVDPKSLLRTKEEIEEYERHEQDLEIVKDLFQKEPRPEAPETSAGTSAAAAEGEEKDKEGEGQQQEEEDESAKDKLAGQLFLMQFPPLTPNLVLPGTETTDAAPTEQPPPSQQPVKREDEMEIVDGEDEATVARGSSKLVTAADPGLSAGRVGKLNVHASGRVTMDWGGISFDLDRATAVDFLQEALIVSTPPNAGDEEFPDDEKKVWAMGQLSGKFTVTPNWEKML
ncbi:putative DNA-directed RNA polymerase III RPC4 [Aspergillus homomorphus CBS 101889]|uniref:RNA polymerase III RPC4-domain-containing protein n=1 Tax=Aspergillus homomorphus (strain CBS 101889) TaxID=1450537 RepID=A0A395I4L1_ASPHC|nr:hypothetical protein BO97DRAFT_403949 [Aspergillus homomorphus CBS 101889]RAL14917.1 hypothetical protein BO97DRAFT_403949 [Aspergillus homomorphus CBS 101889]